MDLDGRTLGEFTLREKIGEGGFAAVHRAEQTTLGREAVVKVLHSRLAASPEVAQRFLREARLASRIDHPYAAHVYAFGAEDDGLLWIAMELVRGTPMDKLLEQGPLTLEQLVPLFERICEVVQNAHDHGIVHRDLKPGNVMVITRGGRLLPKLLDFGIARALDDLETDEPETEPERAIETGATARWVEVEHRGTRRGQVMGSPSYMAPEQWIDAGSVGAATDVYALGVLAFQALTGRVPYTGTMAAVRASHLDAPPPSLGAKLAAIDPVLARALAKGPRERYATVTELASAMRAAAGFEDGALPSLAPQVREVAIATSVQPLAEAVAALDRARNLDQAVALLSDVVTVAIRWIAILALSARTRAGAGADADSEAVRDKLRQLGRGRLDDAAWLALAVELARPFVDKRGAYPVPELIAMLHGGEVAAAIERLRELEEQLRRRSERLATYAEAMLALAKLLDTLVPLASYTLVVPRAGRAERWRGVRRHPRTTSAIAGLVDGRPVLVDHEGTAVLQLSPLVQIAAPAPGRDDELFFLDGKGARTARLVAMPAGFERSDPALHDWLRNELGDLDEPAQTVEPESPYRGLAPFTEEFAGDYVGRERETSAFVNRVIAEPLLAVVGPSGAGKSSFVQAGVLPELPAHWRSIIVRPGASPVAALEAHLQAAGVEVRGLHDDPGALAEAMREAAARESATLVLVIDQLEELFTLCKDDRERAAFCTALADATRTELDPFRVVVTLRDDFLMAAAGIPVLGGRLAHGLQLLAVPAPDELERIVVEPARRAGYELDDPALATEMVDDVATRPGALALLSFTAAELWKLRDRHFRQLTRKAYAAIGGVAGALAKHAETTLSELSAEDQRLVRIAFRHLVTVDGTRQVLTLDELHQLLGSKARARAVVDRLIAARLLVASEDAGGVSRIEIIHEALLAAWPRLVEWRREDAEGARLRDQLRVAARQWDARERPRGLLWRDDALAEYRIWRARHPGMMTDLEEAFGRASLDDEARRRRIRRTLLVSTFVALGAIAIVLYQLRARASDESARAIAASSRAEQEKTRAETEQARAEARENEMRVVNARSTVEADPTTTIGWLKNYPPSGPSWNQVRELALEAQMRGVAKHVIVGDEPRWLGFAGEHRLVSAGGQSVQTWDRATGRLVGRFSHGARLVDDYASSIAVWPDGSKLAFNDTTDAVYLAALPAGTPVQVLHERQAFLAVSPDGRYLVALGRKLQVYEVATATLRVFDGHTGPVYTAVFTTDGSRLFTGGEDGTVRSWNVATGEGRVEVTAGSAVYDLSLVRDGLVYGTATDTFLKTTTTTPLHHGAEPALSIAIADGSFIAATQVALRSWTASGVERAMPPSPGGKPVAWSIDGRIIILPSRSGAQLLDVGAGTLHELRGHRTVIAGAVSPDGSAVAAIGGDGRVRVWERTTDRSWILRGHTAEISEIAFSPDGRSVITAGMDRAIRVWKLGEPGSRVLDGHDNGVYRVAYAPDGRTVAVTTWGSEARIWELGTGATRRLEHRVTVNQSDSGTLQFDGEQLYVATERGISIWNAKTGTSRLLAQPDVLVVELSADRKTLAAGGKDGRISIWDLATGSSRVLGSQGAAIGDLRFLADGSLVSRTDRTAKRNLVTVWSTSGASRVLYDSPLPFRALAVSRAHQRVAVGGEGNAIYVFDLHANTTRILRGHDKLLRSLAFSPDGTLLLSGSDDATTRLWVIESGASQLLHRFEEAVRSVTFSPDGRWAASSSNDHTAWVGELHIDRCLPLDPAALVTRFEQLTTVNIDRARLIQGRNDGATTPR